MADTPSTGTAAGPRVLFVDDEPHLLSGLRRLLPRLAPTWTVAFAESGAAALEALSRQAFDAVVSDLRMPGMDGAQLLTEVQHRYPDTVRLVLSGEAERATVLLAASAAHQFLAKPSDGALIVSTVDRALQVRSGLTDPVLRELIGGVQALPALPAVHAELVRACADPDAAVEEVAGIVAGDVAATVEVLRLTNSSFFGLQRRIDDVRQAVALLGLDVVQAVVTSGLLLRSGEGTPGVDVDGLRRLALRRTAMVRRVARLEAWSAEELGPVCLAALLRDVGALVLGRAGAADAVPLADRLDADPDLLDDPVAVAALERSVCGCTVPQAGAHLLGLWGFGVRVQHLVGGQPALPVPPGAEPAAVLLAVAHQRALRPGTPPETVLRTALGPGGSPGDAPTAPDPDRLESWIAACDEVAAAEHEEVAP